MLVRWVNPRSGHAGRVYMMTSHAGLLAGEKSTWYPRAVVFRRPSARRRLPLAGRAAFGTHYLTTPWEPDARKGRVSWSRASDT